MTAGWRTAQDSNEAAKTAGAGTGSMGPLEYHSGHATQELSDATEGSRCGCSSRAGCSACSTSSSRVVLFSVLNVGLVPMLVIVVGLAFFQYYTSDKIALAASGAKIVTAEEAPELHAMVERLCAMANLPKPRIAVVDTRRPERVRDGPQPEARGGRGDAAGCGSGSSRRRSRPCSAHELSHIANRDVLVMTVASFFAMLAAMLTRFGLYAGMFGGFGGGNRSSNNNNQTPVWLIVLLVSIVVYAISFILIRTISRYREYAADRGSAIITGAPENLMSALQKISSGITQIPQQRPARGAGDERVLHHPDQLEDEHERVDDGSPAAREAPRRPLGDRPRDGQARLVARERRRARRSRPERAMFRLRLARHA